MIFKSNRTNFVGCSPREQNEFLQTFLKSQDEKCRLNTKEKRSLSENATFKISREFPVLKNNKKIIDVNLR